MGLPIIWDVQAIVELASVMGPCPHRLDPGGGEAPSGSPPPVPVVAVTLPDALDDEVAALPVPDALDDEVVAPPLPDALDDEVAAPPLPDA